MKITTRARFGLLALLLSFAAFAGLETVTHIQDLNASWPLGSDLASTSDDHLRNVKAVLKTDFPNMNGVVNSAAAPVFGIPGDADTGVFEAAANDLAISAGGTQVADFSATLASLTAVNVNGATVPAVGIYRSTTNTLAFSTNTVNRGSVGATGGWTIAVPTTTGVNAFAITAVANANGILLTADSTSGQSFGERILGGTTSADWALRVDNQANNKQYFTVRGDGTLLGYAATAAATTDMTADSGTFAATMTGGPSNQTITFRRSGSFVCLNFPANAGVSSATTWTMTGLPATLQMAAATTASVWFTAEDNSLATSAQMQVTNSGTVTFSKVSSVGGSGNSLWTAANNKGFQAATQICYAIN